MIIPTITVAEFLSFAANAPISVCLRTLTVYKSFQIIHPIAGYFNTFSFHHSKHAEYIHTGLSTPLVARSRNHANHGWFSNSKDQETAPTRFTLYSSASKYFLAKDAAV